MRSFYADGLKDLCGPSAPRSTSQPKTSTREATPEELEEPPAAAETSEEPKELPFDPLHARKRPPSDESSPENPPGSDKEEPVEALVASMSNLFAELGESCPEGTVPDEEEQLGEDVIEDILKNMNSLAPEEMSESDLDSTGQGIAEMFMRQLLAKELLYEPMKEITGNYENWLRSDAIKALSLEEQQRHRNLCASMQDLIHTYETEPQNITKLMDLFHKSQSFGSPPECIYEGLLSSADDINLQEDAGLPECCTQ